MRALELRAAALRAMFRRGAGGGTEAMELYEIEREIEQNAQRHETREGQAGGRPLADAVIPDTVSG